MAEAQYRRKRQEKESRLAIVGELYKRGYSYRKIRDEVMARLKLETLSLGTVKKDVDSLLKEWRDARIENTDDAVQLELERIDDLIRELWAAWNKSKTDNTLTSSKKKGVAGKSKVVAPGGEISDGGTKIITTGIEETQKKEINTGDPRYIAEINKQLQERRKLLGLYAPEKKELSGELSFAALLMQSRILEDESK